MTRPAPQPRQTHQIEWPIAPSAAPLWELRPAAGEIRFVRRPGAARVLELVADPFSS